MKRQNDNQMVLPGLETALCKCGCGIYFMRSARGRRREYLNDTHKKREARRLRAAIIADARSVLTPIGYQYLNTLDNRELSALWAELDPVQQAVIKTICEHDIKPYELIEAAKQLFLELPEIK